MNIPSEVKNSIEKLQENGFEAYAVGGCVRDLLLARQPKDWDICTNALPEQIQKVFPDSFYENDFGTVSVKTKKCHPDLAAAREGSLPCRQAGKKDSSLRSRSAQNDKTVGLAEYDNVEIIEVTTYRVDAKYTDKRHPDSVRFTSRLEDDLARRDFTINAMGLGFGIGQRGDISLSATHSSPARDLRSERRPSLNIAPLPENSFIIDPFNGQEDLKNGLIRAVGEAAKRFEEDALRMLRAVRFSVELCSTNDVKQNFTESKKIFKKGGEENRVYY
jgi:tRNA nucleotidyltransferase (CCA-adding enzyme)